MMDADLDRLRELTSLEKAPKCTSNDGKHCLRCGRPMIVDGYIQTLRSCREDAEAQLAAAVPALIAEIARLRANDAACVTWSRRTVEGIEILKVQLAELTARAERAETALRAPEVHRECQQKIDELEVEVDRLRTWERDNGLKIEEVSHSSMSWHNTTAVDAVRVERDALRVALREAIGIFDAAWCPEWGHQPKQDQHDRIAELRKLAGDS